MKINLIAISSILALTSNLYAAEKVFLKKFKNNSKVEQNVDIQFGVEGHNICEANIEPKDKNCGHHHLIIDGNFIAEGEVVPKDDTHLHYGKGQTEAKIHLTPGKHKLTLQFADFAHRSFGPKMSDSIEVEVK